MRIALNLLARRCFAVPRKEERIIRMRRAAAAVALLLAIFLAPLSTLRAEDAKTYAVIVGIGQFEDKAIKDRPSAITDAKAIYDTLTDKSVGGVDPANVQLLLSGKGEVMASKVASKANILAALKDVAAKAHKDDKVIVYLVGQAHPRAIGPVFLPWILPSRIVRKMRSLRRKFAPN